MSRGRVSSGGVNHAPRPAPVQGGNCGSLFRTIDEGIAFGVGSAVAHRAVDSIFSPQKMNQPAKEDKLHKKHNDVAHKECSVYLIDGSWVVSFTPHLFTFGE
ncbi:hypothetical protein JHK86_048313 [Glycine max]|nr:hypothetical protein JHK86_048313 [Glycine max]